MRALRRLLAACLLGILTGIACGLLFSGEFLLLFLGLRSGRLIAASTKWDVHRCTFEGMLGSCIVNASDGFVNCTDLWAGNAVSRRPLPLRRVRLTATRGRTSRAPSRSATQP